MNDDSATAGTMRTYQYAARGPILPDVTEEIRRAHNLQNVLVALENTYEKAKAALWEEDPEVAPLLAARDAAEEAALDADSSVKKCNQELGAARKAGDRASANQLRDELAARRALLAEAKAARDAARQAVKDMKGLRWSAAQVGIERAARERDEGIKQATKDAGAAGLYWATAADTREHHVTAANRVRSTRKHGGPAQLRFQRWDGSGTVTGQVQRERGVTFGDRARLGALRSARLAPREISIALGAGITAREALAVAALRDAGLSQHEISTALAAGVATVEALALSALYDAALGPQEISAALAAGATTVEALALSVLRNAGLSPQGISAALADEITAPEATAVLACEDDKAARSAALAALKEQEAAEGRPAGSSVLAALAVLAWEGNKEARSAAASALAALGEQAAAEDRPEEASVRASLAVLACEDDKTARSAALATLKEQAAAEGHPEDPSARASLTALAREADKAARSAATRALAEQATAERRPEGASVRASLTVLAWEDDKEARSAATRGLVEQALAEGHPEGASVRASLAVLACEDDNQARSAALAALVEQAAAEGRPKGSSVQSSLAALACEDDKEARSAALKALVEQAAAEGRPEGSTWVAQTISRMKADGPETQGQPPASAAMLASEASPWKGVLQLTPGPREDFSQLPRGERRRIARDHQLTVRLGSGEHEATVTVPVTVHRQMDEEADVKWVRLTVKTCGPDLEMSASLPARLPAPPIRRKGRVVCVHTGWRALPDGCLRVAVISGAGPLPEGLALPGGKDARRGNLDGVVRLLPDGASWEVVIPAHWRKHDTKIEQLRGRRDIAFAEAREQAARWLEDHPQADMLPPHAEDAEDAENAENAEARREAGAPDEEQGEREVRLPSPGRLRQWRASKGLTRLARQCVQGVHGEQACELGELLAPWDKANTRAWREEARKRRNLTRRRDDAWAKVAAWLVAEAREVRIDEWDMPQLIRRPGSGVDDDPQAAAARANRVLAAPGELRRRLGITGGFSGVKVIEWELPQGDDGQRAAQSHAGCGGELDPEGRREGIMTACLACGTKVDQDVNMLRLMAAPRAAAPAPGTPARAMPSA